MRERKRGRGPGLCSAEDSIRKDLRSFTSLEFTHNPPQNAIRYGYKRLTTNAGLQALQSSSSLSTDAKVE